MFIGQFDAGYFFCLLTEIEYDKTGLRWQNFYTLRFYSDYGSPHINDFSQPYPTYAPMDCGPTPAPAIFTEQKVGMDTKICEWFPKRKSLAPN